MSILSLLGYLHSWKVHKMHLNFVVELSLYPDIVIDCVYCEYCCGCFLMCNVVFVSSLGSVELGRAKFPLLLVLSRVQYCLHCSVTDSFPMNKNNLVGCLCIARRSNLIGLSEERKKDFPTHVKHIIIAYMYKKEQALTKKPAVDPH